MLPHDAVEKKPMPKTLLILIVFSLVIMLVKVIATVNRTDSDYIYIDCVRVNFIESTTLPKSYSTKIISKSDEERALLGSYNGVFNAVHSRADFHLVESDIESFTLESGNCKS